MSEYQAFLKEHDLSELAARVLFHWWLEELYNHSVSSTESKQRWVAKKEIEKIEILKLLVLKYPRRML